MAAYYMPGTASDKSDTKVTEMTLVLSPQRNVVGSSLTKHQVMAAPVVRQSPEHEGPCLPMGTRVHSEEALFSNEGEG